MSRFENCQFRTLYTFRYCHMYTILVGLQYRLSALSIGARAYGIPGSSVTNHAMSAPSNPVPRLRTLCTHAKHPRESRSFSGDMSRWGHSQRRKSDSKPSIVCTCTAQEPSPSSVAHHCDPRLVRGLCVHSTDASLCNTDTVPTLSAVDGDRQKSCRLHHQSVYRRLDTHSVDGWVPYHHNRA
jgi:hypothetical protein